MAEERGVVESVSNDGWACVVTERRDACSGCGASHCCASFASNSKMSVKALNRAGARRGDEVSLSLSSARVVKTAFILYLIPIFGLMAGALAGPTVAPHIGLTPTGGAILFALGGLALSFAIIVLLSRSSSSRQRLTPIITRVIRAGERARECRTLFTKCP
jgi:sigma-E factor negative regulatory protein RseC